MTIEVGDKVILIPNGRGGYLAHRATAPEVGDKVLLIPNKSGGHIASKLSTPQVGDIVILISYKGRNYILSSAGFTPIPIPAVYYRCFNGYGEYMWELVGAIRDPTEEKLGLYLIKRINNSDNLEIESITKIRTPTEEEISYAYGSYYWNVPIIGYGAGIYYWMIATDGEIYLQNNTGATAKNVYQIDKEDGTLTLKGTLGGTYTYVVAYDGEFIYALDHPAQWDQWIYKIKMSDFSTVATYHTTSWGGMWGPLTVVDDKLWSSWAPVGGGYYIREHNKSDLTLTGKTYPLFIDDLEHNWQSTFGTASGYEYEAWSWSSMGYWRKYSPTRGTASGAIIIDNEFET